MVLRSRCVRPSAAATGAGAGAMISKRVCTVSLHSVSTNGIHTSDCTAAPQATVVTHSLSLSPMRVAYEKLKIESLTVCAVRCCVLYAVLYDLRISCRRLVLQQLLPLFSLGYRQLYRGVCDMKMCQKNSVLSSLRCVTICRDRVCALITLSRSLSALVAIILSVFNLGADIV